MEQLKRHNTWPYLDFEFKDNGVPIDCTKFDIRLVVKNEAGTVVINCIVGEVGSAAKWDTEDENGTPIDGEVLGLGHYEWEDGDTDNLGAFDYEFKFTRKEDGEKFSIPEKGFYNYIIIEDIPLPE